MTVSFSTNCPNGYFLSPIPCYAREKFSIILFVHMPINISANPCSCIVLYSSQLPLLSKLPYFLCSCARMSSKTSKMAKTKHGVKVMGLQKGSSAAPVSSPSSALVEHQETLDVQPLLHAPPLVVQPDLPKKGFKT